jgi:hypothetical protein
MRLPLNACRNGEIEWASGRKEWTDKDRRMCGETDGQMQEERDNKQEETYEWKDRQSKGKTER